MSWKPMETAPKDGTVIVVHVEYRGKGPTGADARFAFYQESEGHWDIPELEQDALFSQLATPTHWIEVPDSSPFAGKMAMRDGEYAREPGKLHLAKVK